jgi:hypothetical protein
MGTRRALVVANDEYADPGLQRLRAPGHDAEALSACLGDPAVGDFDVTVVRNGSVQQLRETLEEFFGAAGRDDELLVHFSCHGLKDDRSDLYLAASDTRPVRLASTGLPAEFVARLMRTSRARSVALFLDCCYGGAVERGMLARADSDVHVLDAMKQDHLAAGAGRVVITASNAVEYAFEDGDLAEAGEAAPSVFTGALVDGIATGAADSDGNGLIGVSELFGYAEQQVLLRNPRQTPQMWSFGTRGDILVARSPVRRVTAAPLPENLRNALAGDLVSRLGAIQILGRRLDDPDAAEVLAVAQALTALLDDDSRSVSGAASGALAGVRLAAVPAALEFRGLRVGTASADQSVVLSGSALTAVARVVSSPDWIAVRQVGERLDVSATCATRGRVAGTITVETPVGSVSIPVTAEAESPAAWPRRLRTPPPVVPSAPPPPPRAEPAPPAEPVPPPDRRTAAVRATWLLAVAALLLALVEPWGAGGVWATAGVGAWLGTVAFLVTAAVRYSPAAGRHSPAWAVPATLLAVVLTILVVAGEAADADVGSLRVPVYLAALLALTGTVAAWLSSRPAPAGPLPAWTRVLWGAGAALALPALVDFHNEYDTARPGGGFDAGSVYFLLRLGAVVVFLGWAAWSGDPARALRLAVPGTVLAVLFGLWVTDAGTSLATWRFPVVLGAVAATAATLWVGWSSGWDAGAPAEPQRRAALLWALGGATLLLWLVHPPSYPARWLFTGDPELRWVVWSRGVLVPALLLTAAVALARRWPRSAWLLALAGTVLAVQSALGAVLVEPAQDDPVGLLLVLLGAAPALAGTSSVWALPRSGQVRPAGSRRRAPAPAAARGSAAPPRRSPRR